MDLIFEMCFQMSKWTRFETTTKSLNFEYKWFKCLTSALCCVNSYQMKKSPWIFGLESVKSCVIVLALFYFNLYSNRITTKKNLKIFNTESIKWFNAQMNRNKKNKFWMWNWFGVHFMCCDETKFFFFSFFSSFCVYGDSILRCQSNRMIHDRRCVRLGPAFLSNIRKRHSFWQVCETFLSKPLHML